MKQLVTLENRTIIVTGAAQGIGRACCELALELGANVVGVDLNAAGVAELGEARSDGRYSSFAGNVTDARFVEQTCAAVVARHGGIHGLVNNAGIVRAAMIEKMTLEQWQSVIDVHMTGSFLWLQAAGRDMLKRARAGEINAGSIVNVSSDAGKRGTIGQINYAAAKAGMMGMTMAAAREWAKYGIRTNTVSFGSVETPLTEVVRGEKFREGLLAQIPMGRWAQPEEVVKTVAFLLSDAAQYTIGQHYSVNGGFHIAS
jgi:3-oxoacyl-[acyl-carrier protein] reductase